jgi:hypothetical protein
MGRHVGYSVVVLIAQWQDTLLRLVVLNLQDAPRRSDLPRAA